MGAPPAGRLRSNLLHTHARPLRSNRLHFRREATRSIIHVKGISAMTPRITTKPTGDIRQPTASSSARRPAASPGRRPDGLDAPSFIRGLVEQASALIDKRKRTIGFRTRGDEAPGGDALLGTRRGFD